MDTHYIFCCNHRCMLNKMRTFTSNVKGYKFVKMSSHTILFKGRAYVFIQDINSTPRQLKGINIVSYEACPNYTLSPEVVEMLWCTKQKKGVKAMSKRVGIMLPTMFTEKLFNKLPKPVYVQPKLEGDRLRVKWTAPHEVKLLSSGGKERVSVPHIREELENFGYGKLEFDGELYAHGMRHSEIRSIVGRTKNLHPDYENIQYHIYDLVATNNQKVRLDYLANLLSYNTKLRYVKYVPAYEASTLEDIQRYYNIFLEEGYEGIVVRHPYAGYKRSKVSTMLKLKPRVSSFFKVIGVTEEETKVGVKKNTFGAFTCVTDDGEIFSVGTGPTAYQRYLLWEHREYFIGRQVKIRFQAYTKVRRVPKLLSIDKEWLTAVQNTMH